ncbi:hypothetical protein [Cupriavidus nantongensis]|uniref:hypothetical protein n=1 Tax=Cupriavidus nantongensis TaxID=1796606 RepID=UPI0022461B39|nr:hypothetical protein [Cupriavidus nantongensis]
MRQTAVLFGRAIATSAHSNRLFVPLHLKEINEAPRIRRAIFISIKFTEAFVFSTACDLTWNALLVFRLFAGEEGSGSMRRPYRNANCLIAPRAVARETEAVIEQR